MTLSTEIQTLLINNINANLTPDVPLYETVCEYAFENIHCDLIKECWEYLETVYTEEKLYE